MGQLIRYILSPEVIIPMMIFAIPLIAVIGGIFFKTQKLKLEKGGKMSEREMMFLQQTYAENQELKQRMANLEEIVINMDRDTLTKF